MSMKTKNLADPLEAAVARIYGPGEAPISTRGLPASSGPAFKLPPLLLDAADLANLHRMAETSFVSAARAVNDAVAALKIAHDRQAHAWRLLNWLEGELVAHSEKHGQPVAVTLQTIEQDREEER